MSNEIIRKYIIQGDRAVYTVTPLRGAVSLESRYSDGNGGEEREFIYLDKDVLSRLRNVLDEVEELL